MKISGVYRIINKLDGKYYIGSAKNIYKRWIRHKRDFRKNTHNNVFMQRVYNKYGADVLSFEIYEITNNYLIREQKLLDSLQPPYNISKSASGGDNFSNHPNREELIRGRTDELLRYVYSQEGRRKNSENRIGDKNPNWKGGISSQYPICSGCGKIISQGHRQCLKCAVVGVKNPFFGKKHSQQTKEKIAKANKGKLPPNTRKVLIEGIIYKSCAEAARTLNVCAPTITFRVRSKYWDYQYV